MKCPLDYELDDEAIYEIERVASDELSEQQREIFFFGNLVNCNDCFIEECAFDENSKYCLCPGCGQVFALENAETGNGVQCPFCGQEGVLYDFRDKNLALESVSTIKMAYLEVLEKGYCLRLFDVGLCFAEREYDNYETLSVEPMLSILEVAREYWFEGKISFYVNKNDTVYIEPDFVKVDTIDDCDYWIVNYNVDVDDYNSGIIYDIAQDTGTFIEYATQHFTFRTFSTLKKYGFNSLILDGLYSPQDFFPDSVKISEILRVDYNKIKAVFDVQYFDILKLRAARELEGYGLPISSENVEIVQRIGNFEEIAAMGNVRKTMKYLRNQISRKRNGLIAKDYIDYLKECRKLGYDLKQSDIKYPSDLQRAHTKTSALVKIENSAKIDTKIREIYERMHKLCEWSDGIFTIIMPSSVEEIVNEGAEQHHCVGNYCERVAAGEDLILFVRRVDNPDKAFYTMEIRPNLKTLNIVQCRGYANGDESKETAAAVTSFLERYSRWFNRRCADVPSLTTKTYFKAVKKTADGRYISNWDGKTEYRIGEAISAKMCEDSDRIAVQGIHLASLEFAKNYGDRWDDVVILEIEVDLEDVIIPDAKDQIRTRKGKVIREIPMSELGEWGERHSKKNEKAADEVA